MLCTALVGSLPEDTSLLKTSLQHALTLSCPSPSPALTSFWVQKLSYLPQHCLCRETPQYAWKSESLCSS